MANPYEISLEFTTTQNLFEREFDRNPFFLGILIIFI